MKRIGVSSLTNTIYSGTTRIDKKGFELWVTKEDMTEQAIKAVFEHMYNNAKETGCYEISIKGFGRMTFTREETE
jgi:nucleoid DNA-binding protein